MTEEDDLAFADEDEELVMADSDPPSFLLLLVIPDSVPGSAFLLLLDPSWLSPLWMTEEDDTLSSFADVPLSPPQAARAMDRRNVRKNRMDPLRFASRMTGRERHFAFASDFLILYSFPSIYPI
jgi:hypothetical protein